MSTMTKAIQTVAKTVEGGMKSANDQFQLDPKDFFSAKAEGGTTGTRIAQFTTSLTEAAQVLNRSITKEEEGGYTNVISPVVMPKNSRSYFGPVSSLTFLLLVGLIGFWISGNILGGILGFERANWVLFGPHYFLLVLGYGAFSFWRNSYVMVPDGCQALITMHGKVVDTVGSGRTTLWHPWKKISYVVNTTREYPYNAPIRSAPTQSRVEASVDLFLQFKIEQGSEFIFTLGGASGFSEKLHNAISEVTRALIYEQKAEAIYDLVGESTHTLLETLNRQFLPAVRFVNANITHAEPSQREYRLDLASPEMIRVAKEAYIYEYELTLRKEQDEGELNKALASLREELSQIKAEIATYQAQIDTAREKAVNRANAYATQRLIETQSEAKANAALLEAQAIDIKTVNSARYPEILEYRFQQEILNKLEGVADQLPQIINIGPSKDNAIDFMDTARQMLGLEGHILYTKEDIATMRAHIHINEVMARIKERSQQIKQTGSLLDSAPTSGNGTKKIGPVWQTNMEVYHDNK